MKKKIKGITLVALVITIIILLILAGVTISILTQTGLFQNANKAKIENEKKTAEEKINLIIMEYKTKNYNKEYNINYFKDYCETVNEIDKESLTLYWEPISSIVDGLETNGEGNAKYIKLKLKKYKYQFIINNEFEIVEIDGEKYTEEPKEKLENDGLLGKIANINKSGNYEIEVNIENRVKKYNTHIIVFNNDLTFDGINQIDGATLKENIYEFGSLDDVGTEEGYAQNMVVLKVNGNITIKENVTLTAVKSENGYGGPKGMMIYCTGNVNNYGTISMTARGAKAEGEDIYLWKNEDGTYEYIPATGAVGGIGQYNSNGLKGNDGNTVSLRATGGGGAGGGYSSNGGNGASGTSYSGGTGGGAGGRATGYNGSENGGQGGNANDANTSQYNGGGAGNPGGKPSQNKGTKGENGTGGTLIIYGNNIDNSGRIESKGSNGGYGEDSSGGASGGGSINIFFKEEYIENGTYSIDGGIAGTTEINAGGNGGNGTCNIGKVIDGTYVDYKEVKYKKIEANSLIDAVQNIQKSGYYKISVNDEQYNVHLYMFNENQKWETSKVFGNKDDVADNNNYASNMIIVKINGNLEIGESSTITSFVSPNGYGGPKGMMIYCTGGITNKGTISMTARGAKAEGENVYLWKNQDGTYEYIPATGAIGGNGQYNSIGLNGNNGNSISLRATGGGGAGGGYYSNGGNGASGTSYSGGTGGGAGGRATGYNGSENGGQGGNAHDVSTSQYNGGGAGNPGGKPSANRGVKGENGTGGTLIIYGNNIVNNGKIESEGSNGGNGDDSSGGASGGGSINIFYRDAYTENGTHSVKGGTGGTKAIKGGNGGDGSFNAMQIK